MMTVERMHIGWRFWLQWVLASVIGWFLGLLVYFPGALPEAGISLDYTPTAFGAALGAGVGIMQWLIVRRHVSGARWWALATMLGLGVTAVVGTAVLPAAGNLMSIPGPTAQRGWIIIMAVGGALGGVMQWSILRRQFFQAGWWVLASTAGWAPGLAVVIWFDPVLALASAFGWLGAVTGMALASAIWLGAVTGLALVWLLRQPMPVA